MILRALHAIAALITVALYFIGRRFAIAIAGLTPVQSRSFGSCLCCGDTSYTAFRLVSDESKMSACDSSVHDGHPKYKKDPDISIDNENIGHHPYDY